MNRTRQRAVHRILFIAVMVVFSPLVLLGYAMYALERALKPAQARWAAQVQQSRAADSICTFARSLDCRSVDTWIIRAVYQEASSSAGFPVRLTDRFADVHLDDDDLYYLADECARLSGRCDDFRANPWVGHIHTVHDLVNALRWQPLASNV